jgi:alpha-D-ribose 1-methylphosphonate 5-triphosphate synthase subunit PhnI
MGYAAVKGGLDAILAAEDLVARMRVTDASPWLEESQLIGRLRLAVDRVQGEGGLASPEIAARAIRQAEGDLIEASLLVRSFRSTLPRLGYTVPTPTSELAAVRRIVPAFREPPGRQLLGRTLDYTERLVDFRDEAAARAALGEPPAPPNEVEAEPRCSPPAACWRTGGSTATRIRSTSPASR